MRKRQGGEPQFPVVRRGYDRAQVDGYIGAHSRWSSEAWVRVQQLEAQVAELQKLVESLQREREQAALLAKHAEAVKIEAERRANEMVQASEARATQGSVAHRHERDENVGNDEDPRHQWEQFLDQVDERMRRPDQGLSSGSE